MIGLTHVPIVIENNCKLGIDVFVWVLVDDKRSRVFWDRSKEGLRREAERTKRFLDIPNVVGFIDGDKFATLNPLDALLQNRDYNGWTKECARNIVCVWNTHGKIIHCSVNLPGNYHDSKATKWCRIYDHISRLPEPYKICCDDAFFTQGFLKGKLVKTKEGYSIIVNGEEEVTREQTEYNKQ